MLLLFKQVSTQCRFPMNHHAEGIMYCVTSYRLGYKTNVQSLRKFYMENGSDKVLGTGRDGTGGDPYRGVFAFSDRLFFISWGWGGRDSGGLSLNNIYPIYRYFRNIFRTPFLGS